MRQGIQTVRCVTQKPVSKSTGCTREPRQYEVENRQKPPLLLGGANRRGRFCSIKLLLGSGADLVEFRMKSADFGIEFDETQTLGSEQFVSRYARVIVAGTCLHVYAGGWQLG
jgi:hypothetical protein